MGVPGQKQPHERMAELESRFAGPEGLLRLRFGSSEVVLLSSPEAVEEALCGENLQVRSLSWGGCLGESEGVRVVELLWMFETLVVREVN